MPIIPKMSSTSTFAFLIVPVSKLMIKIGIMILKPLKYVQGYAQRLKWKRPSSNNFMLSHREREGASRGRSALS